jgi:hypothetical protein
MGYSDQSGFYSTPVYSTGSPPLVSGGCHNSSAPAASGFDPNRPECKQVVDGHGHSWTVIPLASGKFEWTTSTKIPIGTCGFNCTIYVEVTAGYVTSSDSAKGAPVDLTASNNGWEMGLPGGSSVAMDDAGEMDVAGDNPHGNLSLTAGTNTLMTGHGTGVGPNGGTVEAVSGITAGVSASAAGVDLSWSNESEITISGGGVSSTLKVDTTLHVVQGPVPPNIKLPKAPPNSSPVIVGVFMGLDIVMIAGGVVVLCAA